MASFHFDLVSPEKLLFSGEVEQVDVPGSEGDFGVLAGHAPLVSLLRPGILTVHAGGGSERIVVLGGFVEVSADGLTVLADVATSVEDIDQAMIATHIENMEERVTQMEPGSELDRVVARLDHFRTLNQHLSGTAMH
ncbi:MAG: F0F1 ATP synthase subunit epsilon [Pseudomonadota bacterium]|nr:F0F1 ATP synthase subunit epsilon [Pseudomonadota bacterium]